MSQAHRDESRETDIANTMRMPQRHLSHSASRHEAPHPRIGVGTGGPGAAAEVPLIGLRLGTVPDPVVDLIGDWTVRTGPAFNVVPARCARRGMDAATIGGLVAAEARGMVALDDDVTSADAVADEAVRSEASDRTPRSRSPMLGRSFICSPQYYEGRAKCIRKRRRKREKI